MKWFALCFVAVSAIISDATVAGPIDSDKAARVAFVNEFIRELASTQQIRDTFVKEQAEDKISSDRMATIVRAAARMNLELQTSLDMLQQITLRAPFADLSDNLQKIYQKRQAIQDEIIDTASELMREPNADVDYSAIAAYMPQFTARDEYLDKIIFDASPAIFLSLVDERADKQGHASHLIITREQRKQMIRRIETLFGARRNDKDQTYTIGSAWRIHAGLLKNYKSSDDPW